MRARERSLGDPLKGHERKLLERYGVKTARELDEEARIAIEQAGQAPATARPRVAGPVADPTLYEALNVLERAGHIVNETLLAPDPLPSPYYGNNGLVFSGAEPAIVAGAPAVVGTGATIALNDATDNSGRIVLVTGTSITGTGVFAQITFVRPKRNADYGVLIVPADPDACDRPAVSDFNARTTALFTAQNRTAFAASTSYHYDYFVIEREPI